MPGWHSVRHHMGIESFGVNAVTKDKDEMLVLEHSEIDSGQQELFFVYEGHALFSIAGDRVDAPKGTFVAIDPQPMRSAVALVSPTKLIVIGAKQGEAYSAPDWDKVTNKNTKN